MKKITLFLIGILSINTFADVYNAIVAKEHNKYIEQSELPVTFEEIEFFTSKGRQLKDKYITTRGVSSFSDKSCWDINFGQNEWIGDNRGYTAINTSLDQTRFCSSGEKIRDSRLKLPSDDGKYYFEMTLASYSWANYLDFGDETGAGSTFSMAYGYYSSSNNYRYNYTGGRLWTQNAFSNGSTYQVYVDTENGNITFVKVGFETEDNYNNPLH